MNPVISAILVFAGTTSLLICIFLYARWRWSQKQLLEKSKILDTAADDKERQSPGILESLGPYILNLARMLGRVSAPKEDDELSHRRKELLKLGFRSRNSVAIFYGFKLLGAVLLPGLFLLLKIMFVLLIAPANMMLILVVLAIAGFYLPHIWLHLKLASRKEKIEDGFPDALDLLVVCVEAGMGLDSAINRVGEEMRFTHPVISDEFSLLKLELRAGKSRRDALRNFGLRIDIEDVSSLVNILIQTDRFGTSIAQALRTHSDAMRVKRFQRAEERAMKLPVKLVLPLLTCIFPSLFTVILGPPLIQAFRIWSSTQ